MLTTLRSEYQFSSRLKHGVCWTEIDKPFNCKLTWVTKVKHNGNACPSAMSAGKAPDEECPWYGWRELSVEKGRK